MNANFHRPKLAELIFCLYGRAIHPEFFETVAHRRIEQPGYSLLFRLTPSGHIVEWQSAAGSFTEVTTTQQQELLPSTPLFRHRFQSQRNLKTEPIPGIRYLMNCQIEVLTPEIFLHCHEELLADSAKRGFLQHYSSADRLGLSPLSYITAVEYRSSISIATFHTFPNELAIVKTQSLIEPATIAAH